MTNNEEFYSKVINASLRLGFIALILIWSFKIIEPFVVPVLWGMIIAVALFPMYQKFTSLIGNRKKAAAVIITLAALAVLIIPFVLFIDSTIGGLKTLSTNLESGTITIPPPSEKVSGFPIIGGPINEIWQLASKNIEAVLAKFGPQLKSFAQVLFSSVAGLGITLLQFIISIIIAGVFLTKAEVSEKAVESIFKALVGKHGENFVGLSVTTIRSVVQGVLGVAVIQALLGGVGIWAVGIPAAGLWSIVILLLAILQLPPLLVLGPLAIYTFSIADTTPAVIFLIWSILVSVSDAFLKPLFLGRGVDVPMLVILLGAIGGMMLSGIIGLFVGAVVLALSYKVFEALLKEKEIIETGRDSVTEIQKQN